MSPTNIIEEFRAYLNSYTDVARADRFRVLINSPVGLVSRYDNIARKFAFQCEAAELPGKTLQTFEARTYGPSTRYPYQTAFSDLTLSFWCTGNRGNAKDTGIWEKVFFDDWFELINPTPDSMAQQQYDLEYKDRYATTLIMEHFDILDNRTYAVKFLDVFPIAMNPIAMSWQDESIMRLQVAFAYKRWERMSSKFTQSFPTEIISTTPTPEIAGQKTAQEGGIVSTMDGWFNSIGLPHDSQIIDSADKFFTGVGIPKDKDVF